MSEASSIRKEKIMATLIKSSRQVDNSCIFVITKFFYPPPPLILHKCSHNCPFPFPVNFWGSQDGLILSFYKCCISKHVVECFSNKAQSSFLSFYLIFFLHLPTFYCVYMFFHFFPNFLIRMLLGLIYDWYQNFLLEINF